MLRREVFFSLRIGGLRTSDEAANMAVGTPKKLTFRPVSNPCGSAACSHWELHQSGRSKNTTIFSSSQLNGSIR